MAATKPKGNARPTGVWSQWKATNRPSGVRMESPKHLSDTTALASNLQHQLLWIVHDVCLLAHQAARYKSNEQSQMEMELPRRLKASLTLRGKLRVKRFPKSADHGAGSMKEKQPGAFSHNSAKIPPAFLKWNEGSISDELIFARTSCIQDFILGMVLQ